MQSATMLTVKHVDSDNREFILQATGVQHQPRLPKDASGMGTQASVIALGAADPEFDNPHFTTGTVYVMNASGATVAKYSLTGHCGSSMPE